ncbi:MAG: hypothetical protein R3324_18560, partial [Halobacteriales archaeon]|nr:hypothetical protein [Halobacteriales archaeon]
MPPDYTEGLRYGHAVALDGDWIAVGAPSPGGTGAVYLYHATGAGSWELHSTLTVDEEIGDRFGSAVAVSGNRIIVGAPGANQSAGAVYVFTVSDAPGVWDVYGPISGPTVPQSGFGNTIAFDGGVLAVGSVFEDMHNGAVYIFEPDGDAWSLDQRISKPRGDIPLGFGAALAIAGDSLFIGANVYDARGTVYLYTRSGVGAEWQELQRIGQGVFNENYGRALAFEDPWLVVGGVGFDDFGGRISLYRRNGSGWSLTDTFASSEAEVLFGRYVDVSGGIVASTTPRGAHGYGSVTILSIDSNSGELAEELVLESPIEGFEAVTGARRECVGGTAAGFQCGSVDLMSFLTIEDIGGPGRVNDV